MDTLGWLLIFGGVYLVRMLIKGQAFDSEGNFTVLSSLTKTFEGFTTGDTSRLDSEPAGTGLSTPIKEAPAVVSSTATSENSGSGGTPAASLLGNAQRRGRVNKYVWAATGPNAYDCSGLVWRALQDTYPSYKGGRFTTFTMLKAPNRKYFRPVSKPVVGTIVLWKTHIGIVSGDGVFYSARNPRSGIGNSKIAGFLPGEPAPTYWEYAN